MRFARGAAAGVVCVGLVSAGGAGSAAATAGTAALPRTLLHSLPGQCLPTAYATAGPGLRERPSVMSQPRASTSLRAR